MADPVVTEVIRHGLNAAAKQMKVTLCRTAFSPVIYEMIDFAAGIYDTSFRMLAQARALPQFLGTLSFCLEAAVERLGGAENIHPGDVIWSTDGYDNGSHSQDAVVIVPAFHDKRPTGFGIVKAHHIDIAAKAPYCTDTTDVFQEGVIFPAVKLYAEGELQRDMFRTLLANSRAPSALEGDLNAQISACNAGNQGLLRLLERYGQETFWNSVELMFDHGEVATRRFLEAVPDGRYTARCRMDDNGVDPDPVEFSVALEISGSDAVVDFTDAPPQQNGPINCPLPTTVATARLGVMGLLGGIDLPNEGHFRPITVRVKRGTMFYPERPAPIFLYGWPADQATEAMHRAMATVLPESVPAGSGGDLCGGTLWGYRPNGEFWRGGSVHAAGQGATNQGDGGSPLIIISCSGIRTIPIEVMESRFPYVVERYELAPDSGGAGRYHGGCGVDVDYRMLEDAFLTSPIERTLTAPWGLDGGEDARPNRRVVELPGAEASVIRKATQLRLPAGTVVRLQTGGGGGYGPPHERPADDVRRDIENGYVTVSYAKLKYPQAFR